MPFVSYAQNFEDVMLWRALREVGRGFYIDVGAWSPEVDSVTRAFSERGWRGINIEPDPAWLRQLVERRPLDINLGIALGEHGGRVLMNFVAESGLSTADAEIAQRHRDAGWRTTAAEVPMRTLAAVWREHVPEAQPVHFLKVDVEGFERAVLAGNDWARCRPWIVVVEATLPNSQVESHAAWEPLLLQSGYDHAYSDGLNRFYLAREHAELAAAFRYPPNVFDGVVRADLADSRRCLEQQGAEVRDAQGRIALQQHRIGQLDAQLLDAQRRSASAESRLAESRRRIELAEASAMAARQREQQARLQSQAEAGELRRAIGERDRQVAELQGHAAALTQQHQALLQSRAWRVAAALRQLGSLAPPALRQQGRRAAKAAWWAATPWRLPERLRFMRERSASLRPVPLDLMSDAALLRAAGLPREQVLWPRQSAQSVGTRWEAARFCLDLLRTRPDLRARFPKALSEPEASGFAPWLARGDLNRLGLAATALQQIAELLREDFAARARQLFMFRTDVRQDLPHGLTPPGQYRLWRWFMRHGKAELGLRSEEILWLFMQAAEDPALELVRAFRFTPEWQERYPDGLTVFGRNDFAAWFAATHAVPRAQWLRPSTWPIALAAHRQLRQAYAARPAWQHLHPRALDDARAAGEFIAWLRSGAAGLVGDAQAWCAALDADEVAVQLAAGGVNLIGHFCCPSGVRVSAEALAEGLRGHGVESSLRDLRTDIRDEPRHVQFDGMEDFDITLVHTQPEPFFDDAYARSDLAPRSPRTYRIAYWYWEFDAVPESWLAHAAGVDEVWAATEFVAKGLRERLSVPVHTLFPGVRLGSFKQRERSYFGVEEDRYAFLFNFHMNSVMERKNPLGLIEAFRRAFAPDEPVTLVLKTMFGHHHPALMAQLRDAAAGASIHIIDAMYSADEVLSLTEACDAYVSLHRSEGLGLTMAEAMLMGKPVIATAYSGNLDFMDEHNSLLVPFELVRLGRPMPPYDADLVWAEPSVEHAARLMRRLYDEPEWAREVGAQARRVSEERLSIHAAGQRVVQRLAEIRALRAGRTAPLNEHQPPAPAGRMNDE